MSGAFGGAQDRLGTNGPFDRLGTSGVGCGATGPAAPLGSRLRGNDDLAGLRVSGVGWGAAAPAPLDSGFRRNDG